jgi:WNK lysine deficient protein kinase
MLGEITMLRQLKHRNVMRLFDWWYDQQQRVLVFITELLTDGSLRRFLRRKHAAGITMSALKRYAWQILQGLVYLHGHYPPIIHR